MKDYIGYFNPTFQGQEVEKIHTEKPGAPRVSGSTALAASALMLGMAYSGNNIANAQHEPIVSNWNNPDQVSALIDTFEEPQIPGWNTSTARQVHQTVHQNAVGITQNRPSQQAEPEITDFQVNPNLLRPEGVQRDMAKKIASREKTKNIDTYNALLQKSKNASSQSEVLYFAQRFGIDVNNAPDFVKKVKNLQKKAGFAEEEQDGIIGPGTLRILYKTYYSKTYKENPDALPKDIRARWEFYLAMRNPEYKGYSTPNVFSRSVFFGYNGGQNIPNTYLNQKLYTLVQKGKLKMEYKGRTVHIKGTGNPNSIYIGKMQGTQNDTVFTALYDSNGKLQILGPTKAGKYGNKSPENKHFTTHGVGKNYISKKYDAIMPYATFIDWSGGNHSHYGNQNSSGSHGCWRQAALQIVGMSKYTSQGSYNVYVGTSY